MSSSVFDTAVGLSANWSLVGRLPGKPKLERFHVPAAGATVGRSNADIVLPSSFVSTQHARLIPREMGLEIQDLSSRNGTFVGGERIQGITLAEPDDTVAFADVEFKIEFSNANQYTDDAVGFETRVGGDSFEADWTLSNFTKLIQDKLVTPFMQPVVEMRTRRIIGMEALARSEVHGLETPARMFEAAELLDQAALLSEICRERAIDVARGAQKGLRLFLNTHPSECLARDVLRSVHEIRSRAPALRLVIEVHEDLIGELAATRSFTHRLKQMRVEFALDDFGAGRSRINEVLRLRPNFVKFDRSLICNIDHSPTGDQDAVKSLVDLLKSLKIRCVAEGVERKEEADVCRRLGFELAQGFLYAPPAPIEQLRMGEFCAPPTETRTQRKETMDYSVLTD